MDPKGFSDFIAKHGQIVGVEPVKGKTEFDEDSFIYKFEDGATVHYTPAVLDKNGKEVEPAKFIPDESKPTEAARKAATSGASTRETISAPANQEWLVRDGPNGIETIKNPNYKGEDTKKKPSGAPYKNAAGKYVQRFDDGTFEDIPVEAVPMEKPDPADKPQVISAPVNAQFILIEENGQLKQVPNPNYKPAVEAPYTTAQQDPQSGEWWGLRKDGKGWEKIAGGPGLKAPAVPTSAPELPAGMSLGQLTGVAQSVLAKIMAEEGPTPEQKKAKAEQALALVESLGNETDTILRTQGNILTNQTANRANTLQDQASRRTFGANLLENSYKNVMSAGLPMGQGAQAMPAFLGHYLLGMGTAGALGGLEQRPEPGLAPAQQQVMQQGLPQTGGANGIKLTMPDGTKLETVPQSIQQATQPPGDMAVPSGMNVSGGQLRAPGYQAPMEEDPDAMPAFMSRAFA